jgi:hypothetical protein|nr:MAG TPA: hypothetical protein [Caudoviricetes sp.]
MANKAISTLAVGSSVYLNVGGTRTEFLVVHQGLPSSMYDASCNGTWLLMKDCYEKRQWHSSNVNKLESSDIYSYLNGPFLNLFDSNIRDAIKQVKIPYRQNGGSGGSDQSGANGLSCKVFLLSGYEVGFTQSNISNSPVDGAKLDYFESGTSWPARSKRIAYMNGSAVYWYLRSPLTNSTLTAMSVGDDGYPAVRNASDSYGIRPALVLPPNLLVDDSGNVSVPDLTAHKTLINGTAYTVQGGKCMVNGTVYNILKGRTLIDGTGYDITFKPLYDPVFANNTWEQIIEACHNNAVPNTWKVADQKPMTIGGTDYLIDIIGKNHDDYADGSGKAPLTFQLHDCYKIAKAMHSTAANTMGWTKCSMRVEHLPIILKQMPADVQSGIREVNKISASGGRSTSLVTTKDSLFLLSEGEVFGSAINSHPGEGTQYDYYKAGNSTVKDFNGNAYDWWERSPTANSTRYYCNVKSTGSAVNSSANVTRGVAFGFCF